MLYGLVDYDSFGGGGSLNHIYGYVDSNPLLWVDPLGLNRNGRRGNNPPGTMGPFGWPRKTSHQARGDAMHRPHGQLPLNLSLNVTTNSREQEALRRIIEGTESRMTPEEWIRKNFCEAYGTCKDYRDDGNQCKQL